MRPYPVFLRLEGRRVLLVGGSKVAAAKLPALIEAGARVTVVAPAICPELANPGVELRRRPFSPADLEGAFFVVAAAPPEVNRAVAAARRRAGSSSTPSTTRMPLRPGSAACCGGET